METPSHIFLSSSLHPARRLGCWKAVGSAEEVDIRG